jgi:hypothetical protein
MSISASVLNSITQAPGMAKPCCTKCAALVLAAVLVLDFAWVKILKEGGAL